MRTVKYKLRKEDIDTDEPGVYILNLPRGFKFTWDKCHVAGYDSMKELRTAVRYETEPCYCNDCLTPSKQSK